MKVILLSWLRYSLLSIIFFQIQGITLSAHYDDETTATVHVHQINDNTTPSQNAAASLQTSIESISVNRYDEMNQDQREDVNRRFFYQSFNAFIKDMYNTRGYAESLSQNCTHVGEFLELCNEMNMGPGMAYVGVRLFSNKLKEAEIIDASAVIELLHVLPKHLNQYFETRTHKTPKTVLSEINHHIQNIIRSKITDHIPLITPNPDAITEEIFKEITQHYVSATEVLEQYQDYYQTTERLRNKIINLIDICLSKMMWDINSPSGIWPLFNRISESIVHLAQQEIINHMDDLDDLMWTAILALCKFFDIAGAIIPLEVYKTIEQDLENGSIFFLEYPEQDQFIKTKKETLIDYLIQAKARAIAYEQGIMSLPLKS